MRLFLTLFSGILLYSMVGCKSSDAVAVYKLNQQETVVYAADAFMFKSYYFTYKDNQATLIYKQDADKFPDSAPVFLKLRENRDQTRHQEFTDTSKRIVVKVISDKEIRLQLDKSRYTLYNDNSSKRMPNLEAKDILASVDSWKKENQ